MRIRVTIGSEPLCIQHHYYVLCIVQCAGQFEFPAWAIPLVQSHLSSSSLRTSSQLSRLWGQGQQRFARNIVFTLNARTLVFRCEEAGPDNMRDICQPPSLWVLKDDPSNSSCLHMDVNVEGLHPTEVAVKLEQLRLRLISVLASLAQFPPFTCLSLASDILTLPKLLNMFPAPLRIHIRELRLYASRESARATPAAIAATASSDAAKAAATKTEHAAIAALKAHNARNSDKEGKTPGWAAAAEKAEAELLVADQAAATSAATAATALAAATAAAAVQAAELAAALPLWPMITAERFAVLDSLRMLNLTADLEVVRNLIPGLRSLQCTGCVLDNLDSFHLMLSLRHLKLLRGVSEAYLQAISGMTDLESLLVMITDAPIAMLLQVCGTLTGLKKLELASDNQPVGGWNVAAHAAMLHMSGALPKLKSLQLHFDQDVPILIPGAWSMSSLDVGHQISFEIMPLTLTSLRVALLTFPVNMQQLSPMITELLTPMAYLPTAVACPRLTRLLCSASSPQEFDHVGLVDNLHRVVLPALLTGALPTLAMFADLPNGQLRGWEGFTQQNINRHCACTATLLEALAGRTELKHITLHHCCDATCRSLSVLYNVLALRSVTLVSIAVNAEQILALASMPHMALIELIGVPPVAGRVPSCDDRVLPEGDGGRVVRVVWRALEVLHSSERHEPAKVLFLN